jgi:hypothetical protein
MLKVVLAIRGGQHDRESRACLAYCSLCPRSQYVSDDDHRREPKAAKTVGKGAKTSQLPEVERDANNIGRMCRDLLDQ